MSNESMSAVFTGFVEAAKALEEKPSLLAKVAKAESERDFHASRLDDFRQQMDALKAELDATKAELAQKEADLVQATKSEQDAHSKLDLLVDSFRSVVGTATAAVSLVEPTVTPQAAPDGDSQGPTTPSNGAGDAPLGAPQGADGPTNHEEAAGAKASSDALNSESVASTTGQSEDRPTSATNATTQSDATPSATASNMTTSSQGQSESIPTASPDGSGPSGQSDVNPTASSTDGQSPVVNSGGTSTSPAGSPVSNVDNASSLDFLPRTKHYWNKPDGLSWADWQAQGGEVPAWERSHP